MVNLAGLLRIFITIILLGSMTWIAWDQIAFSMQWHRPTWGAAVGLMFLSFLANFLFNNKIIVGRQFADSDESNAPDAPEGGDGGGAEVR